MIDEQMVSIHMYIFIVLINQLKIIIIWFVFISIFSVDCDDNAQPANLANSAVLKFIQEEERKEQQGGKCFIITPDHFDYFEEVLVSDWWWVLMFFRFEKFRSIHKFKHFFFSSTNLVSYQSEDSISHLSIFLFFTDETDEYLKYACLSLSLAMEA